jgi:hypothetical protein
MGMGMIGTDELDAAIRQHEQRDRLFRATEAAVEDEGLGAARIVRWVAKRLGVEAGRFEVKRYPASAAPGVNGFVWRGSRTIYLKNRAGSATAVHEAIHLFRPDLTEAEVRALATELFEEGTRLAEPEQAKPDREVIDYVR